jgi:4-hydroxy-3-polyprenylbenzoate decarboxylase
MAFDGLQNFITYLDSVNELQRIKPFVNPVLEISDIADRMVKTGGKALLFEDTGTDFPLLINAFSSEARMAAAIERPSIDDAGDEIISLFESFGSEKSFMQKIAGTPGMLRLLKIAPKHVDGKGVCQEVVMSSPDLGRLPVLKCWPYDGGRFVTLPLVHTRHPLTMKTNVGMYRMQIMGPDMTGMHWHRHKTGARHFEAWKEKGGRMPVTVTLGGDPVYTYAATAPMPENIDEYLLAGFLRKKRVKLVKCLTNDLWVPADSDFVIEGYVDTSENPVWEGPFGDHTGFYSLADWYPAFHVTCITHRKDAVYPATIVGVPPMEDAWIGKATERIFLAPIKVAIAPEITDIHMPVAGVAHNLVIVRIEKKYPGQGMKVLNSLFGAGQMMFSKYIIVLSGTTSLSDYREVALDVFRNTDLTNDLLRLRGPLDILDHASDTYSLGGKLGIDATEKLPEELSGREGSRISEFSCSDEELGAIFPGGYTLMAKGLPIVVLPVKRKGELFDINILKEKLPPLCKGKGVVTIAVDNAISAMNMEMVAWFTLGNTDPGRDYYVLSGGGILINATSKVNSIPVFSREWPNVVCSDEKTIESVDNKWHSLGIGGIITSPSSSLRDAEQPGGAEVIQNF